ncbi:hypothetical protein [Streptomyces yaizuensis]|uniref:Uncharacterized protein n=1 Tax=Streptomyces yaizuensis TaxID=2989713 RepID=A0ABQ5NTZ2_9ACTN|nr:hypothetical protein [Streptomyces sp. YSPA8]GLF93839.1 hypothetical protein SYYSPA8_06100 [Streptomyces sp. YSPA8]
MSVENMTAEMAVSHEVRALIAAEGEVDSFGGETVKGAGLLLLALLLSANPRRNEPIEDAFGGSVQNLACAAAF